MYFTNRKSDLYLEHFGASEPLSGVTERREERFGFPLLFAENDTMRICSIEAGEPACLPPGGLPALSKALASVLAGWTTSGERTLVCGLGNSSLTADSLGPAVCAALRFPGPDKPLFSFCPGIPARTGIPTAKLVRAAAECVRADRIIAVDALCAHAAGRLSAVLQLSDAGLTPGSGTNEAAEEPITRATMPCPVLTIGVPTVIRTTLPEGGDRTWLVSPGDIDAAVESWSRVIAAGILQAVLR